MKESILIVEDQFVEADYCRSLLVEAGYEVIGIARSYTRALEMVEERRPGFVLLDIFLKGKHTGIDLAAELAKRHIPFVYLSANSNEDILSLAKATQPYGFLVKPFRQTDLLVTLEIAQYRHRQSVEYKEAQAAELLNGLTALIDRPLDWQQKMLKAAVAIQRCIPFDYLALEYEEKGRVNLDGIGFLRIGYDEYQPIGKKELQVITGKHLDELIGYRFDRLISETFQMRSDCMLPIESIDGRRLNLHFFSRRPDLYHSDHISLSERIQQALSAGLSKLMAVKTVSQSNGAQSGPGLGAPSPIPLDNLIGKSYMLLNVFDLVSQVAHTDTSVLILGESGTGKEKIADCIHQMSRRSGQPFIKVNCAALPPSLIESELFGHERGAFTGAIDRRIGKFEKAHKGTIFLDEIGELPVELQVKLLRVLQEKEIERIGGRESIKLDVRIIAATNRNLEKEVAEGRFRLDIYYRLNVFPIPLPALRDRKEDIPLLAEHFIRAANQRAGKNVLGCSAKVLKEMINYSWPGNIRELEHLMERSVLLAKSPTIENIPLPTVAPPQIMHDDGKRLKTIDENERDYILEVLKRCNGRVYGPGAAAEILDLPPSTLRSRMKKLGIRKEFLTQ